MVPDMNRWSSLGPGGPFCITGLGGLDDDLQLAALEFLLRPGGFFDQAVVTSLKESHMFLSREGGEDHLLQASRVKYLARLVDTIASIETVVRGLLQPIRERFVYTAQTSFQTADKLVT